MMCRERKIIVGKFTGNVVGHRQKSFVWKMEAGQASGVSVGCAANKKGYPVSLEKE